MSIPNFPFDGSRRLEARLDALLRSTNQLVWMMAANLLLTGAVFLILLIPHNPVLQQWIGSTALIGAAALLLKAMNFFPW